MGALIVLKTFDGVIVVPRENISYITGHTNTTNTSSVTFLDGSRMHVEEPVEKLMGRVWPSIPQPTIFLAKSTRLIPGEEAPCQDYDDPEPALLEVEQEMLECDLGRGWIVERYKGRWRATTSLLGDHQSIVVSATTGGLLETARTLERDAMKNTAGDTA